MEVTMSPEQAQSPKKATNLATPGERDAEHLFALQQYWKRYRTFPSRARLTGVLGLASPAGVFGVIGRLTRAGYPERVDTRIAPTKMFFMRPVLGAVGAGRPHLMPGHYVPLALDDPLIDAPSRTSLHRVRDNSMRDVGILDGDLTIVELRAPTQPGDIVLAVNDGDITVKTLRRDDDGSYFLEPANAAFEPIYPATSLEVLGVVIGVVRRLRR
jgi:repressor LexA